MRTISPGRQHTLDLFFVRILDRIGEQLAQRAKISGHHRQNPRKRPQPDDPNPDQRPDQRIHPTH